MLPVVIDPNGWTLSPAWKKKRMSAAPRLIPKLATRQATAKRITKEWIMTPSRRVA
jgi:hypothetical protein